MRSRSKPIRNPLTYAGPLLPTRSRARELQGWIASIAAVTVGGVAVMGMVLPRIDGGRNDEPFGRTRADVSNLSTALDVFAKDTGRYPTNTEGLAALCSPPTGITGWKGPYVQRLTNDLSGRRYIYHLGGPAGGAGCRVLSTGRDGKEGTPDDIVGGSDAPPPVLRDRPIVPHPETEPRHD